MANKKKNSASKKLFSAVAMLTCSAVMLSTATYAWFTMNKNVSVTGMELKTQVSGNLLICEDNVEANYKSGNLSQARKALLEPVSTINATNSKFFYTLDAAANGAKITTPTDVAATQYVAYNEDDTLSAADTAAAKGTAYDAQFNTAYGVSTAGTAGEFKTAYGYVDYTFYLKATADNTVSTSAKQAINMTRCNLVKNTSGTDAELASDNDAWRIAVFANEISNEGNGNISDDVTSSDTTLKSILTPAGATYFGAGGVKDAKTVAAVTKKDTAVVIGELDTAGASKYYKVVVRVWLEGEDTTCYSAYYALNPDLYKLDLGFELGKGTAVTGIGSTTTAWNPTN